MTVEQPDALALLDIARETLLERVLPDLDGDARYQTLMIANAMAMAMRELTTQAVSVESETQQLRDLYAQMQPPMDENDQTDAQQSLSALEARLARDLRNGVFDGDVQEQLRQLLRARIESRLAVSNPRRLQREADKRADMSDHRAG